MAGFNLMDMLTRTNDGAGIAQVAQQFGLDESQAQAAVSALLPALSSGLRRNVSQPGGLEALMGALQNGNHGELLDNPERLTSEETVQDGNAILGHILGSRDVSRAAASRASEQTGISSDLLKQILPVVASMAMGALSKQTEDQSIAGMLTSALSKQTEDQSIAGMLTSALSGAAPQAGTRSGGGGLLGGLMGALGGANEQAGASQNPLGGLGNLLDADGDGNSMDDIFDMLNRR
ncbi:DUF937 domain-containing protein [Ponticaulis sp.]|uniref:DUF937 domain-containing protein n=1 Tax=Ponticaulis sp. TaxID=2020902 RepID=UPI000C4A117E|nr:DUF937 domain-containing protein [Ponticaulis sp.]MAF57557.1 hypothetical protein [Ponticaulis sp.]MBN06010.1 hypothetical protein [Ponticaulis sp.]